MECAATRREQKKEADSRLRQFFLPRVVKPKLDEGTHRVAMNSFTLVRIQPSGETLKGDRTRHASVVVTTKSAIQSGVGWLRPMLLVGNDKQSIDDCLLKGNATFQ